MSHSERLGRRMEEHTKRMEDVEAWTSKYEEDDKEVNKKELAKVNGDRYYTVRFCPNFCTCV